MKKTNWHVGDDAAARLASSIRVFLRSGVIAAGSPAWDAFCKPLAKSLCEYDIAQQQQRNINLGFGGLGGEVPAAERTKLRRLYEKRARLWSKTRGGSL